MRLRLTVSLGVLVFGGSVSAGSLNVIGSPAPISGEIVAVSRDGVGVSRGAVLETIPWDRINAVDFGQAAVPEGWEAWSPRGELLNLIRRRIERDDFAAAERLLRTLPTEHAAIMDASDLFVADANLRCLLDRGVLSQAVVPLLEVTKGLRAGLTTDWEPIVDADTGWCAWLPPVLPESAALAKLKHQLNDRDASQDDIQQALVANWTAAAHRQAEGAVGDSLLAQSIRAMYGQGDTRKAARVSLKADLESADLLESHWCRFALGWSLLGERGRGRQREGVARLASIPATGPSDIPILTGYALAAMSAHARNTGRPDAATHILDELNTHMPSHPAAMNPSSVEGVLPEPTELEDANL